MAPCAGSSQVCARGAAGVPCCCPCCDGGRPPLMWWWWWWGCGTAAAAGLGAGCSAPLWCSSRSGTGVPCASSCDQGLERINTAGLRHATLPSAVLQHSQGKAGLSADGCV